jgi:hypothetical protein
MSTSNSGPPSSGAFDASSPSPLRHQNKPSSSSTGHHQSQHHHSSSSSHHHTTAHLTHEERLSKVWRSKASSIVGFFQKAEKTAKETTKENCKELDDAVLVYLRARMEWHRLISHVEAKLQGKAQEMEALENYVRTQPRLGKKRKRTNMAPADLLLQPYENDNESAVPTVAAAMAATMSMSGALPANTTETTPPASTTSTSSSITAVALL